MALNAESVPMRWPAGPLDIARGEKTKGFTAETAEVLRKWQDPASLAVVQGTPVNCLVVSWARVAGDAGQQQALKPLIEKGRQAGLDFVGLIEGEANKPGRRGGRPIGGSFRGCHGRRRARKRRHPGHPVEQGRPGALDCELPRPGRFRWRMARDPARRSSDRRPDESALGRFQRSGPADRPGAGARQDRVDRLRSAAAGETGRRSLPAGRGGPRQLRGQVGDLAGRPVARGPDRQETTGRGYLEESSPTRWPSSSSTSRPGPISRWACWQ